MSPIFYNGHLTHPDIWTMWFSLVVSTVVCLRWVFQVLSWCFAFRRPDGIDEVAEMQLGVPVSAARQAYIDECIRESKAAERRGSTVCRHFNDWLSCPVCRTGTDVL